MKPASLVRFFKSFTYEGHSLTFIVFKGRGCIFAAQLGEAAGYEEGRKLVDSITGPWCDEFKEGYHYDILRDNELRQLKDLLADPYVIEMQRTPQNSGDPSLLKREGSGPSGSLPYELDPKTAQVMVLYEQGIYLSILLTRKPVGRRMRAWLSTDVLPDLFNSTTERGRRSHNDGAAWRGRKGPLEGHYGQIYEMISLKEGQGADGERTPWTTSFEDLLGDWPGPIMPPKRLLKMLQEMVAYRWISQRPVSWCRFDLRTLSPEERAAATMARGSSDEFQLN